ncbi:hypothetical protein [Flavobacterium sp. J27]|uniref:hypothetical protein n=1 Tax=Flavobacterium sp. J27 TaxID=2060419 RepID=UPI0010311625|nr:hypothetical protein [Flavobacterium sp. J27]
MKLIYTLTIFVLVSTQSFAQNFKELVTYSFATPEDYVKAEPKVLEAVNYLFTTPIVKDDLNRMIANQFIFKWMEGTEYTFNVSVETTELTDGNTNLFGMFLAGMSKIVLTHKDQSLTDTEINEQVTQMIVAYCKVPSNNAKPTKKIKKLMKGEN